jgi:ribosomal protein S2
MTKIEFIEATASGLRKMNYTPDYLLIISERFNDWEWDEDTLCGIPVIKSYISANSGYSGHDYPVIPCFRNVSEKDILKMVIWFQRGFEDSVGSF